VHGVGDFQNIFLKTVGGSFGAGVITRIVRGYTFISRNYQPGDQIYIAGFSRGAYTARALAGMITTVGLLDPRKFDGLQDKDRAYRLGVGAWVRYRKEAARWGALLAMLERLPGAGLDAGDLISPVGVEALAVWDTVGALGLPVYTVNSGRMDIFQFTDTRLAPAVKRGIHAVSIDERRSDFAPTLWDDASNVTQVWFAGAHADVGGGYAERGLSDITLDWMTEQLRACGLLLKPASSAAFAPRVDAAAHTPWLDQPWNLLPVIDRQIPNGAILHPTVEARWKAMASYRPAPLRARFS
jgi:glutathione S-transferase